jgi:carbonic anhydrase/acetyltransferase-like protein (isoleucine patch superfamily)
MVIDPSFCPQLAVVIFVDCTSSAVGSVTVTDAVAVHPIASVTVTVYPPAHKPLIFAPEEELDQL